MQDQEEKVQGEERKASKDLQEFIKEVVRCYDAMPLMPIVDVDLSGNRRIFDLRERDTSGNIVVKKFRVKSNCRRCYDRGYAGLFYSNEEQYEGKPVLAMCQCLREIKE